MNENQLFFFGEKFEIYWHGVIMAAAIFLGYLLFYFLTRAIKRTAAIPVKYVLLISFPLALVLSRTQYCVMRQGEFPDFISIFKLTDGGMGLFGAMAGAAAAIFIARIISKELLLSEMFDAAAVAGCLSIALGRFAAYFSKEELGFGVTKEIARKLMFTTFSEQEGAWLVTVCIYEAIAAAVIFVFVLIDFIKTYSFGKFKKGTAAMRFLLLYCAVQALLESWRSDSLFLNSLGFVRFSQAVSAVIFAVVLIVLCVQYAKKYGFRPRQIWLWLGLIALIALAFVCEFTMTGNTHLRNYCGMGAGLAGVIAIGCVLINKARITADAEESADTPSDMAESVAPSDEGAVSAAD